MVVMGDRLPDRPSAEEFASTHAPSALVTAYLLTGDWAAAEDLAAHAIVAGRRAGPSARSTGAAGTGADAAIDPAIEAAIDAAAARRHARSRTAWWGHGGGLQLQETGGHPPAAVDAPAGLWPALSQLTERERAALVLRGRGGLDDAAVAAALGCSEHDLRREIETAEDVVAQSIRCGPAEADLQTGLAAFIAAHRALTPQTSGVALRAAAIEARRRPARLAAAAGATAAVVAAAAVGFSALRPDTDGAASDRGATIVADVPGWATEIQQPSLPDPGAG